MQPAPRPDFPVGELSNNFLELNLVANFCIQLQKRTGNCEDPTDVCFCTICKGTTMFKAVSLKRQATQLGKLFEAKGVRLSRAEKLEFMARIYGARNWNVLADALAEKPLSPFQHEVLAAYDRTAMDDGLFIGLKEVSELLHCGDSLAYFVALEAQDAEGDKVEFARMMRSAARQLLELANAFEPDHLDDFEAGHAKDAAEAQADYGDETVIRTLSGFALAAPAYPEEVDYVRVLDPKGREIAYWCADEWEEAPQEVMGAILGALHPNGQAAAQEPNAEKEDTGPGLYRVQVLAEADNGGRIPLGNAVFQAESEALARQRGITQFWDDRLADCSQIVLAERLDENEASDWLFARSDEIKADYLDSGCQARDVDEAVERLMAECGALFENDRAAWSFLMEEPHEEQELDDEDETPAPDAPASFYGSLEEAAYAKALEQVFLNDEDVPCEFIMDALQTAARNEVLGNRPALAALASVNENLRLRDAYADLTARELFYRLKALAKTEYEKLVLNNA